MVQNFAKSANVKEILMQNWGFLGHFLVISFVQRFFALYCKKNGTALGFHCINSLSSNFHTQVGSRFETEVGQGVQSVRLPVHASSV